eukprot:gene6737-8353_t
MKMEVNTSEVDDCNVFVKYLPCHYTEKELHKLFEPYGDIVNTKVMVNIKTGNSLGYGFVRFSQPNCALEAIKNMNRVQVGYKTLLCKLSKPSNSPIINPVTTAIDEPENREPSNTLYVRVLSPTITDAILNATFSQFGEVVEAQVLIDTVSGKSKRAGVIKFSNISSAITALNSMNGSLQLGETPLVVRYTTNKINNNKQQNLNIPPSPFTLSQPSTSPSSTPTFSIPPLSLQNSSSQIQPIQQSAFTYIYTDQPIYYQDFNYINISPNNYQPQQIPYTYITSPPPQDHLNSPTAAPPPPIPATIFQHSTNPWTSPNDNFFLYPSPHPPPHHHTHTVYYQPHPIYTTSPQISPRGNDSHCVLVCTHNSNLEVSKLMSLFSSYGEVKGINININPYNNKMKSYITYQNVENAISAQQYLDKTKIENEVKKHDTASDAWVTMDGVVYDITEFLYEHPGGSDVVMEYLGKDISKIFLDERSHEHSEAAYNMLKRYEIGTLQGYRKSGPTVYEIIKSKEKLKTIGNNNSNSSNSNGGDKKNDDIDDDSLFKLINVEKAILPQLDLLSGGKKYERWIHSQIGLKQIIIFDSFLEAFTRWPWWYIFILWIPIITTTFTVSLLQPKSNLLFSTIVFSSGLFIWAFVEYLLHRFVFHLSTSGYWGNFFHFFIHGIHHITPNDSTRLTFPPMFSVVIGYAFYRLFLNFPTHLQENGFNWALYGGIALGYMLYDTLHYYFHHGDISWLPSIFKAMKTNHLNHHYKDDVKNFGVTSPIFDYVFGTI